MLFVKARNADNVFLFIVGDTSYGSCCVDEVQPSPLPLCCQLVRGRLMLFPDLPLLFFQVSALHLSADLVVHYGSACLSPVTCLPVLYIFGQEPLDTERCVGALVRSGPPSAPWSECTQAVITALSQTSRSSNACL